MLLHRLCHASNGVSMSSQPRTLAAPLARHRRRAMCVPPPIAYHEKDPPPTCLPPLTITCTLCPSPFPYTISYLIHNPPPIQPLSLQRPSNPMERRHDPSANDMCSITHCHGTGHRTNLDYIIYANVITVYIAPANGDLQ